MTRRVFLQVAAGMMGVGTERPTNMLGFQQCPPPGDVIAKGKATAYSEEQGFAVGDGRDGIALQLHPDNPRQPIVDRHIGKLTSVVLERDDP